MKKVIPGIYRALIFKQPALALVCVLALIVGFGYFIQHFRMDASADALVLENDDDLRFFREASKMYHVEDSLFVAYTPKNGDILAEDSLDDIASIKQELLAKVSTLKDVFTVLDAPLIDSPRMSLSELQEGPRTVRSEGVDKALAKIELQTGVAYGNNLVSRDGQVTAMLITFKRDEQYFKLLEARESIRQLKLTRDLTPIEETDLAAASEAFTAYQIEFNHQLKQDIHDIRAVLNAHKDKAEIFLGGAGMIAVDMVDFIRKDLAVFGVGILALLLFSLAAIFRQLRWVVLPMLSCVVTVVLTTSLLGLLDWPITVISSNYISLLLITTLSMNIHLIVRYRYLRAECPEYTSQTELVWETMKELMMPCFYMAITSMVAFASLAISGIRPVIDFGYTMMCGVFLAFLSSFVVFPLVLQLFKPSPVVSTHDASESMTVSIARFTLKHGVAVLVGFGLFAVITLIGITKLEVENRFIDYFKSDTEIYKGMVVIDQKLGGTTPLEVVISPDQAFNKLLAAQQAGEALPMADDPSQQDEPAVDEDFAQELEDEDPFAQEVADDEFDQDPFEEDEFDENPFEDDALQTEDKPLNYWFNSKEIKRLEAVHDYLQSLPEVGKVMSLATATKMATMVNKDVPLNDFELSVLEEQMPQALRDALVSPYLSSDYNQARLVMRVVDSNKDLRRGELITNIRKNLIEKFGFEEDQVRMTGMLVLYNNMLQSLFDSQIMTLGFVMAAIFVMFIVLFRSVYVAFVAMLPNILASIAILGVIGWVGIPLDLMSITIAAITVGIAVDDAIHYLYSFKYALRHAKGDYKAAMLEAHASVGKAMYYTSLTVVMGFSVLIFSNFIPSIYFGILASLAMFMALLCNLVLLPRLLMIFKPFKQVA